MATTATETVTLERGELERVIVEVNALGIRDSMLGGRQDTWLYVQLAEIAWGLGRRAGLSEDELLALSERADARAHELVQGSLSKVVHYAR